MALAFNPSIYEVEARRYKLKITLSCIARYCLNEQTNKQINKQET